MADYGLLSTGYSPKTINVIREELQTQVRASFGASIDVGDKSIIGQLLGIIAEQIALVWEQSEVVNSSQDPDKATGAALEALCALTGTFRTPATYSTVDVVLSGVDATVIPSGSTMRTASTEQQFETTASATLVAVADWDTSTNYVVGDIVKTGGNVYYCFLAANNTLDAPAHTQRYSTGDVLPSVAAAHWEWMSAGDAAVVVTVRASIAGPIVAVSEDISEIVSAVTGWAGVYNPEDAVPGRDEATDSELRQLREFELSGAGTSPTDAIRADLLQLDQVTAARIFVNNTDITDADGMPPHSVEALVQGGDTQSIIDQLFASVAAGIATTGNQTGTATDTQGTTHTIKFSRPVEVPIYVDVTLKKDASTYEGDDAVKAAIAAMDDDQVVGLDAVASRITAACFGVTGVLDVTLVKLDDAPAPTTSTTVAIAPRELATYSTTNIAVTSSNATP